VVEAAIRAGAKNAYVVKEPILAAIGAGIPIYESKDIWWLISRRHDRCGGYFAWRIVASTSVNLPEIK